MKQTMFHNRERNLGGETMPVKVSQDDCIGCGACIATCPVEALEMNAEGKAVCKESDCIDCGACVSSCPVEAIKQ